MIFPDATECHGSHSSDTIPLLRYCVIGSIASKRERSKWGLEERSLRRGGQVASEERGEVTPPLNLELGRELAPGAQGEAAYIRPGVGTCPGGSRVHSPLSSQRAISAYNSNVFRTGILTSRIINIP